MLLTLAAALDLEMHQLDISNAFLNGDLDELIYMTQTPGFELTAPDRSPIPTPAIPPWTLSSSSLPTPLHSHLKPSHIPPWLALSCTPWSLLVLI
ncbi:hypothetical protein CLOP_g1228 [Closterium sp. NIES-67]|nr:hypothetical protein CLOP_g1228 [Closterium sp. NIES-67]